MNNTLQHHGVKGQKWGVRRYQNKDGTRKRSSKSEDYLRTKDLRKKRASQLSNEELKLVNQRLQLENQYKNLKRGNVSKGRKFVQDVAYETAKNTASDYSRKYMKKGITYMGNRYFGSDEVQPFRYNSKLAYLSAK